ncbi:hypothetical protein [Paracoccus pacificus]|uniref:Uncharacterized protein n=1 Tax=Paracoccus pacificus TaxID=1463598 RepID=A0ABW4RD27_9RHOB
MIGVIVWSNASRLKAVVWCEDQGALAYLNGTDNLLGDRWPVAGDMVELDSENRDGLRYALAVRLVGGCGCPDLPERLRSAAPNAKPAAREKSPALRLVASNETPRTQPQISKICNGFAAS